MACAGLLLTGGTSRRLGVDKALLAVGDERLVDRTARILGAACDPAVEVGPGHSRLDAVREDPPGSGPLAALGAGVGALHARGYSGPVVLVAVDLPNVSVELLEWLVQHPAPDSVVPFVDGMPQLLCARYGFDALMAVPGLLDAGERSLRALLAAVPGARGAGRGVGDSRDGGFVRRR